MNKKEDKETRYYIDLDLEERAIPGWDFGRREMRIWRPALLTIPPPDKNY